MTRVYERGRPAGASGADLRVNMVAEMVESAATAADSLCRDGGLGGDLPARLIQTSHALHLAAVTLEEVDGLRHALAPMGAAAASRPTVPSPDGLALGCEPTLDRNEVAVNQIFEAGLALRRALQHIDDDAAGQHVKQAVESLNAAVNELRRAALGLYRSAH